ncbi:MAG TPA: oligosaccharide flippase family protein, partial [Candidatus Acidoferrales bacterium]|nr:oligosaccharide flippase family protein [Candidatus Acidoferrales bacterium]
LGAVAAVLVTNTVQLLVFAGEAAAAYRARRWSPRGVLVWAGPEARRLLFYGGILLLAGIAMLGSVVLVRTLTVRTLGDYANGIYQVAYGFSNQYTTVYMTWMAAYVFPRVAGESRERVGGLLNSALRANLFLMVPVLVLMVALREPLIRVFYAGSFLPAASLIPIQVLGDYARVVGWSFGVSLFAQGHTRSYLAAILAQSLAWVLIAGPALPVLGVSAVAAGYALSFLAWPALMYPLARRWLGVRIDRQGSLLTLLGLALIAAAIAVPLPVGVLLAAVLPAVVYLGRWMPKRMQRTS